MSYPRVTVDLLDLELLVRAFDNACKELKVVGEANPELRVAQPYPYERTVADRLRDVVMEKW